MTEAEILTLRLAMADSILAIFSMFFGMVSAYVAGLYFFLYRAPVLLKMTAFVLLSLGLLFLALLTIGIKLFGDGVLESWKQIKEPTAPLDYLNGTIELNSISLDFYTVSVGFGCVVGFFVYFALFFLTFGYNWSHDRAKMEPN